MSVPVLHLYDIAVELQGIEAMLEESGGELSPELEATLDQMEGQFEARADRICAFIRNLERSAEAYHTEAQDFQRKQEQAWKAAKRLKGYLHASMDRAGRDRLSTGRWTLTLAKNARPSIRWTGDINAVPSRFRRVNIDVDGNAAYDAWRAQELPEGFDVQIGTHLRIK